jgi:hypothetical protein
VARAEALTNAREALYERDFYLWLGQQAALLREGRFDQLDVVNLVEEIESMGRSDKKVIKSSLVVLLTHLLKHQFQPGQRSSSWRASIREHRQRLRDDFEESPSLRPHAAAVFARAYTDARERASAETGLPLLQSPAPIPSSRPSIPSSCPTDGRPHCEVDRGHTARARCLSASPPLAHNSFERF